MGMSLKLTQCINFTDVIGTGIQAQKIVQEGNKRGIKIRAGSIGLLKIMDVIKSIVLCQPGNVKIQY